MQIPQKEAMKDRSDVTHGSVNWWIWYRLGLGLESSFHGFIPHLLDHLDKKAYFPHDLFNTIFFFSQYIYFSDYLFFGLLNYDCTALGTIDFGLEFQDVYVRQLINNNSTLLQCCWQNAH